MSNRNKFTSKKIAWLLYDTGQAVLRLGLDCVSAGVSRVLCYSFYACPYSRHAAFVFSRIYAGYENLRWLLESTLALGISSAPKLVSEVLTPDSLRGPPPTSRVHHCAHVFTRFTCKYTAWCPVWYFACPDIWSFDQPHRHVASWTYNRYPIADRWHKSHRVMPPTFHHHNHTVNIWISKSQTNYDLDNNPWIDKVLQSSFCKCHADILAESSLKRI